MKTNFQATLLVASIGLIQGGIVEKLVFVGVTGTDKVYGGRARVMFKKVLTDPYNMFNSTDSIVTIPGDGVYYVTIRMALYLKVHRPLVSTSFVVFSRLIPTSQSAPFTLRYGDKLHVEAFYQGVVQRQTLWSVFYVGYSAVAFAGRVKGPLASTRMAFTDVITQTANFQVSEDYSLFKIPVEGLYLVNIGAEPYSRFNVWLKPRSYDLDLRVISSNHKPVVGVHARRSVLASSASVFPLRLNDPVFVEKHNTSNSSVAESGTIFSFVQIGETGTTAFRGDLAHHDSRLYEVDEVVKFGNVMFDYTNMYNNETGVFSIRETGKYAVSLTPGPVLGSIRHSRVWPERTKESLSLILKNKTNHELLTAVAELGISSGTTVGLYLLAGDELRVVAGESRRVRDAAISIVYVSARCCRAP